MALNRCKREIKVIQKGGWVQVQWFDILVEKFNVDKRHWVDGRWVDDEVKITVFKTSNGIFYFIMEFHCKIKCTNGQVNCIHSGTLMGKGTYDILIIPLIQFQLGAFVACHTPLSPSLSPHFLSISALSNHHIKTDMPKIIFEKRRVILPSIIYLDKKLLPKVRARWEDQSVCYIWGQSTKWLSFCSMPVLDVQVKKKRP